MVILCNKLLVILLWKILKQHFIPKPFFLFPGLELLSVYSNFSEITILIQMKLCRDASIQMDLSKNNCFSTEEAIKYSPRNEKRKKVPVVCGIPEFPGSLYSSMFPILSWKLKTILYRDSSTISASSNLEVFCQYVMTSWHYIFTKSSIIDNAEVRDPPLVCFVSVQNITKKIKVYRRWHFHV